MENSSEQLFCQIRDSLLKLDPVYFVEKNLTLDGKPFRLNGNGYKPFADIYRYIGIKALDSDAKPIVLVKGRQVGATTMAAALELFFVASGLFGTAGRPPIRIMHCFPQLDLASAYTKTKLNTMITGAVASDAIKKGRARSVIETKLDKNMAANDSLFLKQFEGGSHIWIESTGLDANRIRGRTVDAMFFDEVQDMKKEALANARKILVQAQYGKETQGVQVYFGTPKQSGTAYWEIWKDSSQQFYHLGCERCKEFFPLYTPGSNEWEKIWLHGFIVRCTHCNFEQNKLEAAERGKWISANPNPKATYVGYHINQLYNPRFSKEDILKEKPENSAVNTERAYQNEVLGEFFSGSAAPITPDEVQLYCADMTRKFTASIAINAPRRVYAGFDWGQKADLDQLSVGEHGPRQGGQSYSCGVILTADNPHILSVEFATKLKRNDFEEKKEIVEQMFRQYSVRLAVGDIGYAGDLSEVLHRTWGPKFLTSRAAPGQMKHHVKFHKDKFPLEIEFERDYYIAELYGLMKDGKIRFPYGSYEQVGWLVNHCCSMEIKVSMDRGGELRQRYVKGSTPNDGFMALLNAYLAYKFDISGGFSTNNPNFMIIDPKKKNPIPAVLGWMPRMTRR